MKTMDELYKYCKKLQIFIFSKKSKKIRNLNSERKCTGTPHLYMLLITLEWYIETRHMTPFFSLIFFNVTVYKINF